MMIFPSSMVFQKDFKSKPHYGTQIDINYQYPSEVHSNRIIGMELTKVKKSNLIVIKLDATWKQVKRSLPPALDYRTLFQF